MLQVHIVYMGARLHDEPELVEESHHELLSGILGRYDLCVCVCVCLLLILCFNIKQTLLHLVSYMESIENKISGS